MSRVRVLIGGGARCGKSAFALRRARELGVRRVFLATARPVDDDMHARIERHRRERGPDFRTIEVPLALAEAVQTLDGADIAVIDCLTLWVSNLLLRGDREVEILAAVDRLLHALDAVPFHVVMVTNEVGMGVHPEHALGRQFRDIVGRMHQRVARHVDEVYFAALGMVVRLRPEPIVAHPAEVG